MNLYAIIFRTALRRHTRLTRLCTSLPVSFCNYCPSGRCERHKFCFTCKRDISLYSAGTKNVEKVLENHLLDGQNYNPWPYHRFTGPLRPFPQTPKRVVPDNIKRPDYGENADGQPLSELALRGTSSNIRVLPDEEIEEMRIACKVRFRSFVFVF